MQERKETKKRSKERKIVRKEDIKGKNNGRKKEIN
jgi:hypothetical protein